MIARDLVIFDFGRRIYLATVLSAVAPFHAAAGAEPPLVLSRVADGVFVYVGAHGEASPENLGAFANAGVIVGERSVAVIDTGGSLRFGRRLRAAVRSITDLPVSHVINTHVHPDHVFGNAAFEEPSVRFVGHRKLARALAQRAPFYLQNFERLVGAEFADTRVVLPDLEVETTLEINLGNRRLRLRAHPTAHSDNDLTVLDQRTGTLFAGDLLFMERLPVLDGSLKGWLRAIAALRRIDAQRAVPGHGPATGPWPAALDPQERYLQRLLEDTRQVLSRGGTIEQAIATVAKDEAQHWLLYDSNHARNVTASFTELEWE